MNKTLVVVILVLILAFLIYYGLSTPVQNIPQVPQTQNQTENSLATSTASSELDISIQNFSFSPSVVTIAVGTRVVWINNDSTNHTVDGGTAFKSATLKPGDTFSYTFTSPGTFTYVCDIHPSMKGEITVGQ